MPQPSHNLTRKAAWIALFVWAGLGLRADAAGLWEHTPYQVKIWIACGPRPELSGEFVPALAQRLVGRAEAVVGGAWRVVATAAPETLRSAIVAREEISVEQVQQAEPDLDRADKIVLVIVDRIANGYAVDARELDVATRQWGLPTQLVARQLAVVPDAAMRALAGCFAPLGRIDSVDDRRARVVLKASAMAGEESPILLAEHALLQPVSRRNDRLGRAQTGGINLVPWTLLEVDRSDEGKLDCTVHSALRRALSGHSSYRTKRLALAVHSRKRPTVLALKSRVDREQPLSGYHVLTRTETEEKPRFLGETDANGRIVVPVEGDGLQTVYVKSGGRVLARLPIVPGREEQVTVWLPDDEPRLAAEAFLAGIEDRLTDVTVQRAFTAARIRTQLAEGKVDEANELLREFRQLPTQIQLNDALQNKRAQLKLPDPSIEAEIDKLFRNTRDRIARYLDPQLERRLAADLAKAKPSAPARAETGS